jgi:SAM-dependent methyltransferase
MRLQTPKHVELHFLIGEPPVAEDVLPFVPLAPNPAPQVDYSNVRVPQHLTRNLLSYFPKASSPESKVLDLGCGSGVHRAVCEHAGFEWIGLDYESPEATLLGDGHALPFADNSFDFVLSIAVLEHIRYPFVTMREVWRVLKPGGVLIGTVAFSEPYHGDCYYHHTHLGVYSLLRHAGLNVQAVAPHADWLVLKAQATMSLFPYMPRPLAELIVLPVQELHRLWWWAGGLVNPKATEQRRVLFTAGAYTYIAGKDASGP